MSGKKILVKIFMVTGGFKREHVETLEVECVENDIPRKIQKELRRKHLNLIDKSENCQCLEFYAKGKDKDLFLHCIKLKCKNTKDCSCCSEGVCEWEMSCQ